MKTHKLDSLKKRCAALVLCAVAAIAAGCGASTAELMRISERQETLTKAAWARDDANETARIRATADVAIQRERRLAEQAATQRVKYVTLQTIAATADAGGKAAIAVSLTNEKDSVEAAAPPVAIAPAAPTVVPVFAFPKTTAELWVDFGKSLINSPLLPALAQGGVNIVQTLHGTKVAKINADRDAAIAATNGETTRNLYDNFSRQNASTVGALRDSAASGNGAAVTIANAGAGTAAIIASAGFNSANTASNNAATIAGSGLTAATTIAGNGLTAATTIATNGQKATERTNTATVAALAATSASGSLAATNIAATGATSAANIANAAFTSQATGYTAAFNAAVALGNKPTPITNQTVNNITSSGAGNVIIGQGNNTVSGTDNRVSSPGPCVASPTTTVAATTTPAPQTTATSPVTVTAPVTATVAPGSTTTGASTGTLPITAPVAVTGTTGSNTATAPATATPVVTATSPCTVGK
jgi:trimeric autotransporter adhesin